MTSAWVIIPARGGSVGVPKKNLQPVGGVPLITRAVRAVSTAKSITRTFIATDDDAITAAGADAEIVSLPQALAAHGSSSETAMLHTLETLKAAGAPLPDLVVLMQCTSPFTTAGDIDGAVKTLIDSGADTLFSGYAAHYFLWDSSDPGNCRSVNHDSTRQRQLRQDRPPEIIENGALYVMRCEGFLKQRSRFFGRTGCYLMPKARSLEIDTPEDLALANHMASFL